jgi:hypothetical protein
MEVRRISRSGVSWLVRRLPSDTPALTSLQAGCTFLGVHFETTTVTGPRSHPVITHQLIG